jgi:cytidyltransferase-like protein
MRTVIVSGGFDPLHSGHVAYLQAAASLGDQLVVGVNSDAWLIRKKGYVFMPFAERVAILSALGCVDLALPFDDSDGTARALIYGLLNDEDEFIFANGGDRKAGNVPEQDIVAENLMFVDGIGGSEKLNSSSELVKVHRLWGFYHVLYEAPGVKVKRLSFNPRGALSYQRHQYRAEHWLVQSGHGVATIEEDQFHLYPGDSITIPRGAWHRLKNREDEPLQLVEVQYGTQVREDDIERMGQ